MNERILSPQLLKLVQAAGPGYSQADPEWVKTFAELIIRECCNIANNLEGVHNPGDCSTVEYIKEHFGV